MVVTLLLCKNLVNRIDSLQKDHRARKSYVCVQEHAGTACPIDKTIASKSKPLLYSLAPHQSGGYLPNQPHCMRDRTPVHLRRPPPDVATQGAAVFANCLAPLSRTSAKWEV